MKRRYRLRRKAEFQSAQKQGRRIYSGRGLVALAIPNDREENRVGVTVSRQFKSSVERNRACCGVVKSWHQTKQSALSSASAAYEANDLIRFDAKIDIAQHVSICGITKTYRVECDRASCR